ncbi:hypothetical protein DICPUDRAFT_51961, partial [Dictyostelium purpureum]
MQNIKKRNFFACNSNTDIDNENNKINNIIYNKDNKNRNNDKLFFSIWRNKCLLNEIQRHQRLYNENRVMEIDESMDQLLYHSHRGYATKIRIHIDEPLEPYGEAIPYGTTELEFTGDFNQPIRVGDIPPTVTSIEFCDWYTHQIDIKSISIKTLPSIETLELPLFNQVLKPNELPPSVTKLTLRNYKHKLEPHVIPPNVKKIDIGSYNCILHFKEPLPVGLIPNSVEDLSLPHFFNHPLPVGFLPESLTKLDLGFKLSSFNKPLKTGDLPITCKNLFLHQYNQPLQPNVLPPHLEIFMTLLFNCPIQQGSLPESITKLQMFSFDQPFLN